MVLNIRETVFPTEVERGLLSESSRLAFQRLDQTIGMAKVMGGPYTNEEYEKIIRSVDGIESAILEFQGKQKTSI